MSQITFRKCENDKCSYYDKDTSVFAHEGHYNDREHPQEVEKKCDFCPAVLVSVESYRTHLRNRHSRGYLCRRKECLESFDDAAALKAHKVEAHGKKLRQPNRPSTEVEPALVGELIPLRSAPESPSDPVEQLRGILEEFERLEKENAELKNKLQAAKEMFETL